MLAPSGAVHQGISRADFFTVNFPGEPEVREITYPTEYRVHLPGRVYSFENGPNRYSVTVVDYTNVEAVHPERPSGYQPRGSQVEVVC